jgi:hypothetical protein
MVAAGMPSRRPRGPGTSMALGAGQIGHQGTLELAVEGRFEFQALRNGTAAPRAPGGTCDSHRAETDPRAAPRAADDDHTGAGFQSGSFQPRPPVLGAGV